MGLLEPDQGAVPGGGGEFGCAAVYPSPAASLRLGRQNLHLFRFKNTRFDVIGGAFYFLMVVRGLSPFAGRRSLPPWRFAGSRNAPPWNPAARRDLLPLKLAGRRILHCCCW